MEGVVFDLFNPRSQAKLSESVAVCEGPVADDFNRAGNVDAGERVTLIEGVVSDLFNPRSQAKLCECDAVGEGFLADDFD